VPTYTLNRNYLLHTTTGNSIQFLKGKPTFVPKPCARDAVSIGAELVEGDKVDILEDEVEIIHISPEERVAKMKDAFRIMQDRDERGDFTGTGVPNLGALEKLTGFMSDAKERNTVWEGYLTELEEDGN
jgi:hypothetical protein